MGCASARRLISVAFVGTALYPFPANAFTPNDPDLELQWGLINTGQSVDGQAGVPDADIDALEAWDLPLGEHPIVVAIVGPGVNPHPELSARLLEGFAVAGDPYDSLDECGFATALAGIIAAATNDGIGIAGVNGLARILPVRVTNDCTINEIDAAAGIRGAVDAGAPIILVALQLTSAAEVLADAVEYATLHNALVIAPAGGNGDSSVTFPARFEACMAVSATTNRDELSPSSNFGPEIDIAAPGRGVWSTDGHGGYAYGAESRDAAAAAAFVAGVASLVWSYNPQLSAEQVRSVLLEAADDLGSPGVDPLFGAGRINARRALDNAPLPAVRFERVGPFPGTAMPGVSTTFRVKVSGFGEALIPGSPTLLYRFPPAAFVYRFLVPLGSDEYRAELPPGPCGSIIEYYLLAAGNGGSLVYEPPYAPQTVHRLEVNVSGVALADDFESDKGWTIEGGDNSTGRWARVVPIETSAQPGFDYSPDSGRGCFVTGQHFGGLAGTNDVDGGPVTLVSPVVPVAGHDIEVSYGRWFHCSGVGQEDQLIVEVSRDAGASWVVVEQVSHTGAWVPRRFRLSEFPELSGDLVRVRFSVSDDPDDSLTEAAIDEFEVRAILCSNLRGDTDADGDVDLIDFRLLHACWSGPNHNYPAGPCGPTDLTADGLVDLRDLHEFQRTFGTEPD